MPLTRQNSATAALRPARRGAKPSRAGGNEMRPEIWVEGRQAPAFVPLTYARAGALLTRLSSARALLRFAGAMASVSAFFGRRDWSGLTERLGRVGGWLPTAPGISASFAALSECAGTAQRMLYALPDPAEADAADDEADAAAAQMAAMMQARRDLPTVQPGQREPVIRSRDGVIKPPSPPADPDIDSIRSLMAAERQKAEPVSPKRRRAPEPRRAAQMPRARTPDTGQSRWSRLGRWTTVRMLAGGAFALTSPVGFGKALWRHLDGTDLRETIDELEQTPGKASND